MEALLDRFGDPAVLMMAGACVGIIFGMAAQHSRFCLRGATVELAQMQFGPRMVTWLIAFGAAVISVQTAIVLGFLDVAQARQLSGIGSLSGAIMGGLMFGVGMILARGCASRLLILSATGNLRALVTGLVLTLVAQGSLRGVFAPAREYLAQLWMVDGGASRSLLSQFGLSSTFVAVIAGFALLAAIIMGVRLEVTKSRIAASGFVGLAVGLGWVLTYAISQASFEVVAISSVTFTGPSADTLMGLVNSTTIPMGFGIGLVPGVFVGAGAMALATKEARIERFGPDTPMERYLTGAALMGFGSMLAGGCAVGAGMSGGAIFSLTAWLALFCMWFAAMLTHRFA